MLYFLPAETGELIFLQEAHAIAADGYLVAALSRGGTRLSYYPPGATTPTRTLSLPAPCLSIAPRPEARGFLLGGAGGLWEASSDHRLKALTETPALNLLSHASFVLAQTAPITIMPYLPQPPYLPLPATTLPGPLQSWWIEGPNSAGGTFRYRDTLYAFSYQSSSRLFTIDTVRLAPFREKATSPYLTQRWGTEYTGTFTLSLGGTLLPLNISGVRSFAADFFGGYLYYVRSDTLWERNLHNGAERLRATPFRGHRLRVIGAYDQGRAKITTR